MFTFYRFTTIWFFFNMLILFLKSANPDMFLIGETSVSTGRTVCYLLNGTEAENMTCSSAFLIKSSWKPITNSEPC